MQTTLLSIGIALILALLAALVGPHFVDWNTYRGTFEIQASQLTGLNVRILGPIKARLLPTPSVTLRQIDVARPGEAGALQASRVDVEFALGALVRGEWKAADVRIEGAELALGIDRDGRPDWPAPSGNFDPSTISIERLDVRESRILLNDAASGASAVFDRFEFTGQLQTLAGPLKGQGSFYHDGQHYPYRVSASPPPPGASGTRVRVTVDPIDLSRTAEVDAVISVEDGIPRFEGSVQMARPVARAAEGSKQELVEPWRLSGRMKGDSRAATIEQVEFQYGPDDRAIKLRGNAQLTFGNAPVLGAVLTSPQVDLDRILALPDADRGRPAAAIKVFTDQFVSRHRLAIPVELSISIESLTLAGATLQRVAGDLRSTPDGWNLQTLEFRAPGLTQAQFAGRLGIGERLSFAGRARIDSRDPNALIGWLTGQADAQAIAVNSLSIDGEVQLGNDAIVIDRLRAELDKMRLEGGVAYLWPTSERAPRLEASLRAPVIDVDRTYALVQKLLEGTAFDPPREGEVKAEIGRASFSGVEVRRADVNMRFNSHGVEIERLAIGDLGGATLAIKGRIDTRESSPSGALTFELGAKRLEGVTALLEKVSPEIAGELRRNAKRFAPAKLRATLAVTGSDAAPDANATGTFKIEGVAGTFEIALDGGFGAGREDLSLANLDRLKAARIGLGGRIESEDGNALLSLLGLERLVAATRGRGRMEINAKGPLDGDMELTAQLFAGGLDASANGNLRLAGSQGPTAGLELKVANANLIAPRVPGRPAAMLPLAMTSRLALAEGVVRFTDISGKIAGADLTGRLRIGFGQPLAIGGDISLGTIAMPPAIAAVVGVPQGKGNAWSTEPFEPGLIGNLEGQLTMRLGAVGLTPALSARDVRTVVRFEAERMSLEEIDGTVADGRVAGGLTFQRNDDGVAAQAHLRFASADLAALIEGGALTGRVTLDLDVEGAGRSPTALIGAFKGSGTFTFQDGTIARLDPSAFEAVMRAVEQGLTVDAQRVGDRMETALGSGPLHISLAQGELVLAAGQLRLANTTVRAKGAELTLNASLGLADNVIDARMTITGPAQGNVLGGAPPQINVSLRGPIAAPKRALDVTSFSNWLAMRAIEEKAKRIDALESGAELPAPPPAGPAQPEVAPIPQSVPQPTPAPASPTPRASAPAAPAKPAPVAKKSAAPVDIRPEAAARAQQPSGTTAAKPQPKPAAKPARSWLENLLGP